MLLAAPTTPDDRLVAICERSRGFVYGVSLMGVTGERTALASQAGEMGRRLKAVTDLARAPRASASPTPSRRSRRRGSATASSSAARWSPGCSRAAGPMPRYEFVAEVRTALDARLRLVGPA